MNALLDIKYGTAITDALKWSAWILLPYFIPCDLFCVLPPEEVHSNSNEALCTAFEQR